MGSNSRQQHDLNVMIAVIQCSSLFNSISYSIVQCSSWLHLFAYYTISIKFVLTRYYFCRSGWKCELHLEERSEENIMAKCVNCVCSLLKRSTSFDFSLTDTIVAFRSVQYYHIFYVKTTSIK